MTSPASLPIPFTSSLKQQKGVLQLFETGGHGTAEHGTADVVAPSLHTLQSWHMLLQASLVGPQLLPGTSSLPAWKALSESSLQRCVCIRHLICMSAGPWWSYTGGCVHTGATCSIFHLMFIAATGACL
jgi:hypothetical protein